MKNRVFRVFLLACTLTISTSAISAATSHLPSEPDKATENSIDNKTPNKDEIEEPTPGEDVPAGVNTDSDLSDIDVEPAVETKLLNSAPRTVAQIHAGSGFARAVWRKLDKKLETPESLGAEQITLSGYEYRYRKGSEENEWSEWIKTMKSRSEWLKDIGSGSEIAFQVRSMWSSIFADQYRSKTTFTQGAARPSQTDGGPDCDTQLGRQPGVAYATGGERTYVDMTTNLCMGSLLAEGEDLRLKGSFDPDF